MIADLCPVRALLSAARHAAFLILALAALTGCQHFDPDDFRQPTITDTTQPWLAPGTLRRFTATIDMPDGFRVDRLTLRFARHSWPGPGSANQVTVPSMAGVVGPRGPVTLRVGAADAFPDSHALYYRWDLDYSVAAGGGVPLSISTPVTRFVIGCPPAVTDLQLTAAMNVNMTRFTTGQPARTSTNVAMGYPILPHRRSSIDGNGFTLSNLPIRMGQGLVNEAIDLDLFRDAPQLNRPDLLFYAPRPRAAGETLADYMDDISAPDTTNNPYTFIGVAYTQLYDPDERPIMGCIPSDAWFVHEAGYHLQTGQMFPTPPAEGPIAGSANMLTRPPGARPGQRMLWHPRLWDLHVWIDPAGGPPVMSIYRPGGVPGLALPPVVFFRPETWE